MSRVRLFEACDFTMGQSPSSESYNIDGRGIPFYQGNADFGKRMPVTRVWCDAPKKKANAGDILLSIRAPIGAINVAAEECCIGRGLAALAPKEGRTNSDYLQHFLRYIKPDLERQGTGSTFKAIGKSVLSKLELPLPSVAEQTTIANNLDLILAQQDCASESIEKLDELVKSRFVEMFGNVRTNEFNWPVRTFEELADVITDGEHATPKRQKEGIYLLSARNVKDHRLDLSDVDFIGEEEYQRISRRIIPKENDVLVSCSGTIGKCCVVPAGLRFQMVRSAALIRFSDAINPIFAEWLITSDDLQEQIRKSATQSSQANLFQGRIKKLLGIVPPLTPQQEFAAFVQQVDKLKFEARQAIDKLQMLYDSLAQEYFGS